MRRHSWNAVSLVSLALTWTSARADDSNFRPYIVGGRAAGMAGAFTALADDGSGPYYNPGGLAFVDRSMLSLSASVYGLVKGSQQDALGDGHDFKYSNLNIFPVSTAAIMKFGSAGEDGVPVHALALTVFVPDGLLIDDQDALLGSSQNAVFVSQQQQTIWVGGTYARRLGRVGLGVSTFLLMGTSTAFTDLTVVNPATTPSTFATLTLRGDMTMVGAVAAIGLRYDITDELKLGLSFFTPELGIYGSRRVFLRIDTNQTTATTPVVVVNHEGLHATPALPWRAQAGVAWISGGLTLAADAIVLGPRETIDDVGVQDQGLLLERRVKRNLVVNGSVGLEYVVNGTFPVRAGFFTDFAASPASGSENVSNTSHMDRYGLTASIGYRTEHTSTDLGINVSYASGKDLEPKNLDLTNMVVTGSTQTLMYVFLASSYRF